MTTLSTQSNSLKPLPTTSLMSALKSSQMSQESTANETIKPSQRTGALAESSYQDKVSLSKQVQNIASQPIPKGMEGMGMPSWIFDFQPEFIDLSYTSAALAEGSL